MHAVRPEVRPGARVVGERRRAAGVATGIRLEVARARFEAHDPVVARARALPFAESGLHDVRLAAVALADLRQHERRDAVPVVHAGPLRDLGRMEDAQIDVDRIGRIVADHAVVPEHGADVGGVVESRALGVEPAALIRWDRQVHLSGRERDGRKSREGCESSATPYRGSLQEMPLVFHCGTPASVMPSSMRRGETSGSGWRARVVGKARIERVAVLARWPN